VKNKWEQELLHGARWILERPMPLLLRSCLLVIFTLSLGGCLIWPLKVAEELDIEVIDATSGTPIPYAEVVYVACDAHDFSCRKAKLVRTQSDDKGKIEIDSTRRWGVWLPAPGGIPVPNHLIAIWAPGYSAFVFSQYPESIDRRVSSTKREDIIRALREIPSDQTMNDESLNPRRELIGGKIKLRKM
jgi:hypothetical protein